MKLIINADDFGWDKDANEGILLLCQAQKLNGVSIMANCATDEWIDKLVPFQSSIRLGLHVVLNEGMPLCPQTEILSLVDEEGFFYSSRELWQRYLLGKVDKEHIKKEVLAQVNRLRKHEVLLYHADSHQHLHHFPFLGQVILQILREAGITSIRNALPSERNTTRRRLIYLFWKLTKRNLRPFSYNDVMITYFDSHSSPKKEVLDELLFKLSTRNIQYAELMCHPALADRTDCYLKRREEFDFLMGGVFTTEF